MSKLLTYNGKVLDTENMTEDAICLDDITFALYNLPRFNGHVGNNWSVLHHSVLVSSICNLIASDDTVDDPILAAFMTKLRTDLCIPIQTDISNLINMGLLHDATEAYLADIPKPLKKDLHSYLMLEEKLKSVIMRKFGIIHDNFHSLICKAADNAALRMEGTTFFTKWTTELPDLEFKFDIITERLLTSIQLASRELLLSSFSHLEGI